MLLCQTICAGCRLSWILHRAWGAPAPNCGYQVPLVGRSYPYPPATVQHLTSYCTGNLVAIRVHALFFYSSLCILALWGREPCVHPHTTGPKDWTNTNSVSQNHLSCLQVIVMGVCHGDGELTVPVSFLTLLTRSSFRSKLASSISQESGTPGANVCVTLFTEPFWLFA